MKSFIIFAALIAIALAAPPTNVEIVKSESDVGPESFQYAFATSDGTKAEAHGNLKNAGTEDEALAVQGSYAYVGDDGQTYSLTYTADENGFQPHGAHLPEAPQV
ncbi:larval cuticle protein 65Ag1-like [Haematobia irritans]|uniref:larval cuticle protein 65Ag1-like n=1 Tax=Haematobia irritans TaxID=7368 RepID=UPI003F50C4FB